ncbi:long-chain-fatty-acid--CoA ligase [Nocardia sp. SYP-A9097]|uniref:long-chain-fatty-acid--CoA ligase n=1 Tax=Nocardia sp. SYP-A9097 TaxID=2663237 RepID=UPI00129B907A|nr:long-chain fatty acid--CoA ligase [Nocardia sp. SYP-A9097]MRH87919.1 long-chain-fatty-acid--CoA ligase [Nocardia sp. SYP-A9097]
MSNLALNLAASAANSPAAPALRIGDRTLDYATVEAATARVAGLLRDRGLVPGDVVGICLPNIPEFAICYYGVLRAGGIVVPLNPLLTERELTYHLVDSGAKLLFAWSEVARAASGSAAAAGTEPIPVDVDEFDALLAEFEPMPGYEERAASDTAVILYTSGTTGKPKGAELTHANLAANCDVVVSTLLHLTSRDVVLGILPLFHVFGQTFALNAAMKVGALLALVARFEAGTVLEVLARDRVTVFEGVPTMYSALLHHPGATDFDVSSLRVCVSGGASMPVEVMRGFEAAFGCTVLEGYGLSETSPVAAFNPPDRERKPGSIGLPVRGVELRLLDDAGVEVADDAVGEIVIRGHNVMKGYWRNPAATTAAIPDGWFRTGDLARRDADGYYYIVDRKKDLVIRGGYNVYPREIEEVLYEHEAVAEVAVIGLPDARLGEEVCAVVALKPGATTTAAQLIDFAKARVAAYKYPRHVHFVEALPKGATGKILKREIVVPGGLPVRNT